MPNDRIYKISFTSAFPLSRPVVRYWLFCTLSALAIVCSPLAAGTDKENERISHEQMAESIDQALANYGEELKELEGCLDRLEILRERVKAELETFDSLNTAHSQLLIESQPRIESLDNAIKNNRLAFKVLSDHIEELEEPMKSISDLNRQTAERIGLARKQIEKIRSSELSGDQKRLLEEATERVLGILEEKKRIGGKIQGIHGELLDSINSAIESKNEINQKLKARLESLKKASLTKRFNPFMEFTAKALAEEFKTLLARVESVFSPSTWKMLWVRAKLGGLEGWTFFFGTLLSIAAVLGRFRRILLRMEEKCEGFESYYRRLAAYLIRHSLPYLFPTVFSGIYSSLQYSLLNIGLERVLFRIFLTLTTTRWGLDYLRHAASGPQTALRSFVCLRLRRFFRFLRALFISGAILTWIDGTDTLLLWVFGTAGSAFILSWLPVFWRGVIQA